MTVERKKERAKRILLKSGFISKFHFILSVMNGNRTSTNPIHETKTRAWGRRVLDENLSLLKIKYPKYGAYLDTASWEYFNTISDIHNRILDEILANATEEINKENND